VLFGSCTTALQFRLLSALAIASAILDSSLNTRLICASMLNSDKGGSLTEFTLKLGWRTSFPFPANRNNWLAN